MNFEIPIITKTINVNNLKTAIAKSINWDAISRLIEYSFKKVHVKATFTTTVLKILLFGARLVL